MPSISSDTVPQVVDFPGFCEFRAGEIAADRAFLVSFETYLGDKDWGEEMKGLPQDHCQSPHWGYVFEGRVGMRYDDGTTEEFPAGSAFYVRPGHIPITYQGAKCLFFSTKEDGGQTLEVVHRNLLAAQAP